MVEEPKTINNVLLQELLYAIRNKPTLEKAALNVEDLSAYIGVPRKTIYNKLSNGTFPIKFKRIGSRPIFSKKVVDAWLEGDK